MSDKSGDFWQDAAAVYQLWRSGKKSLAEMTDGDLKKIDQYLHAILFSCEFRRSDVQMQPSKRRISFKFLALLPAAFIFFVVLYSLVRGIR